MSNKEDDNVEVSFPASPAFTRIGRVAIEGLSMRLGITISSIKNLQSLIDTIVTHLQGSGRISVNAQWEDQYLEIAFENPDTKISEKATHQLQEAALQMPCEIAIKSSTVHLTIKEHVSSKIASN